MIYGGDTVAKLPVKDLYDTSMMVASINAAKDMYDQGIKRMDDFQKAYGDFYSPISNDVDYWYNNTTKPVRDAINYLYANGIDPTRSAEGRAMIQRVINQAPAGELAKLKQTAENAKIYQKNRADLISKGLYSPELEAFDSGGLDFDHWDTAKNGVWTRTSPIAYQTLQQFTEPVFKAMKPHELTPDQARAEYGSAYDPRKIYTGITHSDAKQPMQSFQASVSGNPYYKFYLQKAKQHLIDSGVDPNKITDAMVSDQFSKEAIDSNYQYLMPRSSSLDPLWQMQEEFRQKMAAEKYSNDRADARQAASDRAAYNRALLSAKGAGSGNGPGAGDNQNMADFIQMLKSQSLNIKDTNARNQWMSVRNAKVAQLRDLYHKVDYAITHPGDWSKQHMQQLKDQRKKYGRLLLQWRDGTSHGEGLIDKNGNPTQLLYDTMNDLTAKGYMSNHDFDGSINSDSRILKWENDNIGPALGKTTSKIINDLMSPSGASDTFGKSEVTKYKFGDGSTKWAKAEEQRLMGGHYTSGSLSNVFNNWLNTRRVSVFVPDNAQTRVGTIGKSSNSKTGTNFLIRREGMLSNEELDNFLDYYRSGWKEEEEKPDNIKHNNEYRTMYANKLGLSHEKQGGQWGWAIPITNTVSESDITTMWLTNQEVYNKLFSQSTADSYRIVEQVNALSNQ